MGLQAKLPHCPSIHIFEIKWARMRCILFFEEGEVSLQSRGLNDVTRKFPELSIIAKRIKADQAILDGELIIASNANSDFYQLKKRWVLSDARKIERASKSMPSTFVAFDVLKIDDRSLRSLPLIEGKAVLSSILVDSCEIIESRFAEPLNTVWRESWQSGRIADIFQASDLGIG